ncbi:hypothetical protein D6C81_03747 [Aureobasidium pullulans]|nr:hypothetical protein D6C81_03747 [Aureobasidium pullulans]
MSSSRRTVLRQPLDRGEFRQRSDGNNVFIDKIMKGRYTPFLLELVRQQRLILKSEEVDEDILFGCFFRIIMGIHSKVLIGVMQGDIAERYHTDKETKQILDLLLEDATGSKRPGIYCNSIGRTSDGSALSRNELIIVVEKMQAYVDNDSDNPQSNIDIDSVKGIWKHAHQRYLVKPAWRIALWNDESAILEFGYGLYIPDRLKAHRSHTDSNYIMNLYESICHVMWPGIFRLHQFAIFLIVTPDEAATSEMVLTLCGNGYHSYGTGFSHHAAGQSSSKAFQLFKPRMTAEFLEWSTKNGPLEANVAAWKEEDNVRGASDKTEDMSKLNELVALEEEVTTGMSENSRQEGLLDRCDEVDTVVNGYEQEAVDVIGVGANDPSPRTAIAVTNPVETHNAIQKQLFVQREPASHLLSLANPQTSKPLCISASLHHTPKNH